MGGGKGGFKRPRRVRDVGGLGPPAKRCDWSRQLELSLS